MAGVLRALKRLLGRASSTNKNPGSSPWSERVEGFIPREEFLRMIERDKVFKRMRGEESISYRVWRLLEGNAATLEALSKALNVDVKSISNAIKYLRKRYGLKIRGYYNPQDKKYYYVLEDEVSGNY